jgi:hypothetical protein
MSKLSDEKLLSLWQDTAEKVEVYRERTLRFPQSDRSRKHNYGLYKAAASLDRGFWAEIDRRMKLHGRSNTGR